MILEGIHPDSPMKLSPMKKCPTCTQWVLNHGDPHCRLSEFISDYCISHNRQHWKKTVIEEDTDFITKDEMDIQ